MYMDAKQLISLSPVPIKFVDIMINPNWSGVYFDNTHSSGYRHIEIRDDLTDNQKIGVLIHEIGHAICNEKSCRCMQNPDHLKREIHASKFVLLQLLKYKQKEILKNEMECLTRQANGNSNYEYYIKAAKHVMKLKLWQKCLNYVK